MKHLLILLLLPLSLLAQGRRPSKTDDSFFKNMIAPKSVIQDKKAVIMPFVDDGRVIFYGREASPIGLWHRRDPANKPSSLVENEPIEGKRYTSNELAWLYDGYLTDMMCVRDSDGVERCAQMTVRHLIKSDTVIRLCPMCVEKKWKSDLYITRSDTTIRRSGHVAYFDQSGTFHPLQGIRHVARECVCIYGHRFIYESKLP